MYSCTSYIDVSKNSFKNNNMKFEYGENENKFEYFNNVNAIADHEVYYTTHFSITLPKGIVNWRIMNNNFFIEYEDKQIFYIYTSYVNKNEPTTYWNLDNATNDEIWKIMNNYWDYRGFDLNYLHENHAGRDTKMYSNGKYSILLYNIKRKNMSEFIRCAKTFKLSE